MDAHGNGKGTSATAPRALALFVVLAVGALGVAALVGSLKVGIWDRAGPGPGLFPLLASTLIVGCTALRLLTKFQLVQTDTAPHWRRLGFYVAALLALVVLFWTLGFPLSCALALMVMVYLGERRPLLQSVVFAVAATAASLVLFDFILSVPLPWGVLAFMRPWA